MRVIIPTNNETCWRECVATIRKNEPFLDPRKDIIAVTDGIEDLRYRPSGRIRGARPFCFSTNVNWGINPGYPQGHDPDGAIILNHDALLETPGGFSSMIASCPMEYGIVSAAVRGACCNPTQEPRFNHNGMIDTDDTVAFVCVYIPRRTIDLVGLLDERLVGYGYDDDLYCAQVRAAGLKVGVWHGCVVEHGSLPSSYRTRPDCGELMAYNHRMYHQIVAEKGIEKFSYHHTWCRETFGDSN